MIKVGIFDSGLGGFSILDPILKRYPSWDVFYIADHAFSPYGNKPSAVIIERSELLTQMLLEQGVDLIIVACNTATAHAIESLRSKFSIPFVGIEPYLNVINRYPELVHSSKGIVLSTTATNDSDRFKQLRKRIDPDSLLDYVGLPGLASIVEAEFGKDDHHLLEEKVREELTNSIFKKYDFAILGCTHYPLISSLIESILGVTTYSPGEFVINRAAELLEDFQDSDSNKSSHRTFNFLSTNTDVWKRLDHSYIKCF